MQRFPQPSAKAKDKEDAKLLGADRVPENQKREVYERVRRAVDAKAGICTNHKVGGWSCVQCDTSRKIVRARKWRRTCRRGHAVVHCRSFRAHVLVVPTYYRLLLELEVWQNVVQNRWPQRVATHGTQHGGSPLLIARCHLVVA